MMDIGIHKVKLYFSYIDVWGQPISLLPLGNCLS